MGKANVYKRVPTYWWDFEWVNGKIENVVVESDHPHYPVVVRYAFSGMADSTIARAEKVMADLRAGRVDIKKLVQKGVWGE